MIELFINLAYKKVIKQPNFLKYDVPFLRYSQQYRVTR